MKITKTLISTVMCLSLLVLPAIALAQTDDNLSNWGLDAANEFGLGQNSLTGTIQGIISVLLGFLGILAVLLVLWGGFIWMTAAGDDAKIDKAKKLIVSGIIGIVIIFSAWAIANFVITQLANATGATQAS